MIIVLNILIVEDHPLIIEAYKTAIIQFCNSQKDMHPYFHIWKNLKIASQEIKKSNISSIDLVLLDMQLPSAKENKFLSGMDVGIDLRKRASKLKILVITSLYRKYQIKSILKGINPEGLIIKNDIGANDLNLAIRKILSGEIFYSQSVNSLIKENYNNEICLDPIDHKLLYELSQGSKTNELPRILYISKTSVERRKRKLKLIFEVTGENDRKLLDIAREKGFI